jgi:hypothetical protein
LAQEGLVLQLSIRRPPTKKAERRQGRRTLAQETARKKAEKLGGKEEKKKLTTDKKAKGGGRGSRKQEWVLETRRSNQALAQMGGVFLPRRASCECLGDRWRWPSLDNTIKILGEIRPENL